MKWTSFDINIYLNFNLKMENLKEESDQSEENEITTKPQTEKILITQTKEKSSQPEKTKKKKRHKKKKTPKKIKKDEPK